MEIVFDKNFISLTKKLPKDIKLKLVEKIELLRNNPFNSKLHTKHLSGELHGFLSFRINRDYRVIFNFLDTNTLRLFLVKHRKDIYKLGIQQI